MKNHINIFSKLQQLILTKYFSTVTSKLQLPNVNYKHGFRTTTRNHGEIYYKTIVGKINCMIKDIPRCSAQQLNNLYSAIAGEVSRYAIFLFNEKQPNKNKLLTKTW